MAHIIPKQPTVADLPPRADLNLFIASGLLGEINRLILHPCGYQMIVSAMADSDEAWLQLHKIDDPEGIFYEEPLALDEVRAAAATLRNAVEARLPALGFGIQPVTALPQITLNLREGFTEAGSGPAVVEAVSP